MVLTPSQNVEFKPETFIGTTKSPLVLKAGSQYIQTIHLLPGWNWISLNVTNEAFHKVSNLLSWYNWREGDMLTDENNNLSLLYQYGQWISNKGSESLDNIALSVSNSYRVKVVGDANVELTGNIIKSVSDRTITIDSGWNSIGYTPMINLPVSTALADYLDDATDGDVVKSKTQFAIFTIGANGSREWKGNLQYMKPGEGYMLYRQKKGMAKFAYPFYESNATFLDGTANIAPKNNGYAHNMTMTAIVDGIEILSGDRIIAYSDGEVRGETIINAQDTSDHSPLLFLTIAGDKKTPLNFIIEREGDIIAATGEVMSYENDAISGSPKKPTPLVFKQFKGTSEGLYDLSGRKIPASSMFPKGVYIINGRKFIVK